MTEVLNFVMDSYCNNTCHSGPPSKLIGYKSSGTCLDYIYKNLSVPYSFAWEIYSDEKAFPALDEYKVNSMQSYTTIVKSEVSVENLQIRNSFFSLEDKVVLTGANDSSNINMRSFLKKYSDQEKDICLSLFNPIDKLSYEFIIDNWTKVKFIYIISNLGSIRCDYKNK